MRLANPWIHLIIIALSGCTLAPTVNPPIQNTCPKLPKLPEQIHLNIDGDTVNADQGGELVLRGYVACRSAGAR